MKNDIQYIEDVQLLVQKFYEKAFKDDLIQHFFKDIPNDKWQEHLPIMYQFWSSILLNEGQYKGQVMYKHQLLHQKHPIESVHMNRWKMLFFETLDENFEGKICEEAKRRVQLIAPLILHKVNSSFF